MFKDKIIDAFKRNWQHYKDNAAPAARRRRIIIDSDSEEYALPRTLFLRSEI